MDSSSLGKLPAELRNRIYEMVLTQSEPIQLRTVWGCRFRPRYMQQPQLVSLFSVCRQTQQECASLFYSQNGFMVPQTTMNGYKHSLKSFIAAIGPRNADSLRKVTVQMNAIHQHEVFQPTGRVEKILSQQLHSLEEMSLAHPRLRVLCAINMFHYGESESEEVDVELNMTDWNSSKEKARKMLEPFMRNEGQPTGKALTAKYLMKILDQYESVREEN